MQAIILMHGRAIQVGHGDSIHLNDLDQDQRKHSMVTSNKQHPMFSQVFIKFVLETLKFEDKPVSTETLCTSSKQAKRWENQSSERALSVEEECQIITDHQSETALLSVFQCYLCVFWEEKTSEEGFGSW